MHSKMVQLPIMAIIALAPAAGAIRINSCVVRAVNAALNPYDGASACAHPDEARSKLAVVCGSTVSEGMSVFSAMCKSNGTPIQEGGGAGNLTAPVPAVTTAATAITTGSAKLAPAPMTTMTFPVETRTYTLSFLPGPTNNGSHSAPMTTAYPTAPAVVGGGGGGGPGVNKTTTTAVTAVASGHHNHTKHHTEPGSGSGLVVEPKTDTTSSSSATTAATTTEAALSSALAAALAAGHAGPIALAIGAGLLAAW